MKLLTVDGVAHTVRYTRDARGWIELTVGLPGEPASRSATVPDWWWEHGNGRVYTSGHWYGKEIAR